MPGGSRLAKVGVSMQTAGRTHEGLGPRTKAPDRYDNHLDSPGIHPDGRILAHTYAAAHRLTDVSDSLRNTIRFTLDAVGNRIK